MANKILLISHNFNIEGAPISLLNAAIILKNNGYSVECVSFEDGPLRKKLRRYNINAEVISDDAIDDEEFFKQYDLLIVNTVLGYKIVQKYDGIIPTIWYIHESKMVTDNFIPNIKGIDTVLKHAENVVVVSDYAKDYLIQECIIKDAYVLNNFVEDIHGNNSSLFEKNYKNCITFSIVGTIYYNKGFDILLQAYNLLDKDLREKCSLNLIGNIFDQEYYEDCNRIIEDRERVKWYGCIDGEKKWKVFNETDVFVIPSRDESCSLVALEAMMSGKPLIISDNVGAKYAVSDKNGWVFNSEDVMQLSEILNEIVCGKYDLQEMGKNSRKQYEKYATKEKYTESLLEIVKEVMDNRNVNSFSKCTGCTACVNSCPYDAITMESMRGGFLYPGVDKDKCVNCGICRDVCHVVNTRYDNNKEPGCYAAMSKDDIRMGGSSSGGIFPSIAYKFIQNGGYVCGAAFDEEFNVEHIIINSCEDICKLTGSKYVQSDLNNVFIRINELLDNDENVLFSGTPCQVAGLKSYLKKDYNGLLCVDIVCNGAPSPKMWRKYLDENFNNHKINSIDFRDKKNGWNNSYIKVETENGVLEQPLLENPYGYAFLNDTINRDSCYECRFAKIPRQGDITLGDFWGIEKFNSSLNDKKGTSLVLINNKKGKQYINSIKYDLKLFKKVDIKYAIGGNPNIVGPSISHKKRNVILDNVDKLSFNENIATNFYDKCDCMIINFWFAKNYGAILTCYALQVVLKEMGFYAKVVNFFPSEFNELYNNSFSEKFADKYLELTQKCYSYEDLDRLNTSTDTFIVGSDQVWRYDIFSSHGGYMYLLDFVEQSKRKIGCCVSFGYDEFIAPDGEKEVVKYLLDRFTDISVRENEGQKILEDEFNLHGEQFLDPVFYLSEEKWSEISSVPKKFDKYIFSFVLAGGHNNDKIEWIDNVLSDIEKEAGIEMFNAKFSDEIEVEEWLSYIKNCELVVTDSYHAICFAIILNKPFIHLEFNSKIRSRTDTIFRRLNLKGKSIR